MPPVPKSDEDDVFRFAGLKISCVMSHLAISAMKHEAPAADL